MSESNDPPLVRKAEEAPLVRKVDEAEQPIDAPRSQGRPPLPPFARGLLAVLEASLWAALFLVVQLCAAVVVVGVAFAIYAFSAPDPKQFVDEQLNGASAALKEKPEGEAVPIPHAVAASLAWGMLAAQFASLLPIAVVLPLRVGRGWRRQLGVRTPYWLHVALVVLILPGFIVGGEAVQSLFQALTGIKPSETGKALGGIFRALPLPLTLLAVAVGPGFVEEFWCRGLMGRVLTPRIGIVAGVAVTSFLFGAMHMDPAQLPAFICMGAFLHFVYFATRSIWASILLHVMNNASAVVLALTLSPEKAAQPTPFVVVIAGLALLIFGGIALWTSRAAVRPVSVRAESSEWKPEYPGISAPPPDTGLRLEHEAVSPVAFIFTILSFGMLVYLGYRFLA